MNKIYVLFLLNIYFFEGLAARKSAEKKKLKKIKVLCFLNIYFLEAPRALRALRAPRAPGAPRALWALRALTKIQRTSEKKANVQANPCPLSMLDSAMIEQHGASVTETCTSSNGPWMIRANPIGFHFLTARIEWHTKCPKLCWGC